VIAIINKNKAAVLYIFFKVGLLLGVKLYQFVAAQITKWVGKNIVAA
jgi:hypothetical protein